MLETNQQNSHGVSKEEAKSQKTEDDGENPAFQNMLIENFSNYTKRRQFLTRRYHTKKVRTLNCFSKYEDLFLSAIWKGKYMYSCLHKLKLVFLMQCCKMQRVRAEQSDHNQEEIRFTIN